MKTRLQEFLNFIAAKTAFTNNVGLLILDGSSEDADNEALAALAAACSSPRGAAVRTARHEDDLKTALQSSSERPLVIAAADHLVIRSGVPFNEFDGVVRVSMMEGR